MKKQNKKNKYGFTLIELLVLVLIIGILSAIALPMYRKAVERSRVADALSVMDSVAKSEHNWYLARGRYTDDFSNLDVELTDATGNKAYGNNFDNVFYEYELLETGILTSRNNGEYYLYKDYDTLQIMCAPSNHYICDNLPGFTKAPCQNAELFWASTDSTCYADPESRCNAYGTNLWHKDDETPSNSYCGYANRDNDQTKTLNDGMECRGDYFGCRKSIINEGGICRGNGQSACSNSTINDGGICIGNSNSACANSTITAGGICIGNSNSACANSTITAGGVCESYGNTSCKGSYVYDGGECRGKSTSIYDYNCYDVTVYSGGKCTGETTNSCGKVKLNGGTCEGKGCSNGSVFNNGNCKGYCYGMTVYNGGICSGGCQYATVSNGGICSGGCSGAVINTGGICSGECSRAVINTGGICKSSETNSCKNASYPTDSETGLNGCCAGNYCGNKPKCDCKNSDGSYATSC